MIQFTSRSVLLGAAALLAAVAAPAPADAHGTPPLPRGDQLVVTVRHTGQADGTYLLRCHPSRGNHPNPAIACTMLDRRTIWGRDPFAPVPPRALCTMQYGGPATAHISGTWAGRPVDAQYDRRNGCQVARWDSLVPLLPDMRTRERHHRTTAGAGARPS
ncbi:SSI family serine proteinase inhibitor [Streptomyces sp. NPDC046931]|uniref:SSI family serine proteinase inhibitor n=1 Tax=Streptomyces sp. NPDC046931 TaxID=3154806 RepID=UPI0033E843F1